MMKLLVSIGSLGPGGAERVLSILSKTFADAFQDVEYVIWHNLPIFYEIDKRVKIHVLSKSQSISERYAEIPTFRRHITQYKPDIILSFLTPYNMLACLACTGLHVKLVVAERNDPNYLKGGFLMKFIRNLLYNRANLLLMQTTYGKSCYPKHLQNKSKVIPNPIIMPCEYVGSALYSVKDNRVVSVGRLDAQKDQKTLIDAFAIFSKSHPDWVLEIYGDGPLRSTLEAHIQSLNLTRKVFLPGTSNQLWEKIKGARIFVLSSIAEGMSNALIEAMCLGLPVISTKVAGSADIIDDKSNGYIVNVGDSIEIAQKLMMLSEDKVLQKQMGEHATQLYDKLKIERICQHWITALKNI